GSTWPPDEEVLLGSLRDPGGMAPPLRLVLAPHEPGEEHLRHAEGRLATLGLSCERLAAVERSDVEADVVLVDRVGVLGDLYAAADVAYVGGGWGTAGLHSVLEPAAFGVPVLFGPRHANAREAAELIAAGGAFSVADGDELRDRISWLWRGAGDRRRAG